MKRWRALALTLVLLVGLGFVGWHAWGYLERRLTPERCSVTNPGGEPVTLSAEQSRMASIIVAASYVAGLNERAATIALATAYQESGIRNLDHGDRDSLGLFQQRPDPRFEWGTAEEIMDPWYSSLRFYEELVKFPKWESTDINDQAQKVQRSGHPQAYRKHVPNATALAKVTRSPSGPSITCVSYTDPVADPDPLVEVVSTVPGVKATTSGNQVRLAADSKEHLWSAVNLAMLNSYAAGITRVEADGHEWKRNGKGWTDAEEPVDGAVITLG